MATKHIHYDCIIAWANGATIQYWKRGGAFANRWVDLYRAPLWNETDKYRVKPASTIIKYRVAIVNRKAPSGDLYPHPEIITTPTDECFISSQSYFIEWAGNWETKEVHI